MQYQTLKAICRAVPVMGLAVMLAGFQPFGNPDEAAIAEFPEPADLRPGSPVTIDKVLAPHLLLLADGRHLRLLAIAPFAQADREQAAAARRMLDARLTGRRATPFSPAMRTDRYGRLRAHLRTAEGVWIQHWMARSGLARIAVPADAGEEMAPLLGAEAAARSARRGLWSTKDGVAKPEAPGRPGQFAIVEGRVESASLIDGTLYLNFGKDYRTDFTFRVERAATKGFPGLADAPGTLSGQRVRVRGWLERYNGPMIDGRNPAQLEILDPQGAEGGDTDPADHRSD